MSFAVFDFESRSPIDIRSRGTYRYTEHPDTEPYVLGVGVNNEPPKLWVPDKFWAMVNPDNIKYPRLSDKELKQIIREVDYIVAQNSMFDMLLWNHHMTTRYGFDEIPLERWHDTMAQLGYHALPLNLEQGAKALKLPVQKDMQGHKAMLKICKPRKPRKAEVEKMLAAGHTLVEDGSWYDPESDDFYYIWNERPELYEDAINYCADDIRTTQLIHSRLADLPPTERKVWLLDQRINLRGVQVDTDSVESIVNAVQERDTELKGQFTKLTNGAVSGPRSYVALKNWVNKQAKLNVTSVDKVATEELLLQDIPEKVKAVLRIKAELAKSSVAKFRSMLEKKDANERIQGMFCYHGASTGRWAGRAVQLHNLPRESYDESEYDPVVKLFKEKNYDVIDTLYHPPFMAASRCVRGSLVAAPGHELICADYSAVEGRGLAYLAGEEWVVKAYRKGEDMYKHAVAELLGISYEDVTKAQRQIGKVEELLLGYAGGIGAFVTGAITYGIDLESLPPLILPLATEAELKKARWLAKVYIGKHPDAEMSLDAAMACDVIKQRWREKRPNIRAFWHGIETTAITAVKNPGKIFEFRGIKYAVHGGFLKCMLPSGRVMHYYAPRISSQAVHMPIEDHAKDCRCETCLSYNEALTYMGQRVVDGKTTSQWVRIFTYSGKLVENIVQAFCRDILAFAMLRLDKAGYPIIIHVHDEAIGEVLKGTADLEEYYRLMEILPSWAKGMPVKADGWIGKRYRK